jgi:hypothetical protein
MKVYDINEAEKVALRFLDRLSELRATKDLEPICGSKQTGALRRASLDLTRALANLRRSS